MLKRVLWGIIGVFALTIMLVSCGPTAPSPLSSSDVSDLSPARQRLAEYGNALRRNYANPGSVDLDSPSFIVLEEELSESGLIDIARVEEIEQGIIYNGMFVDQLIASVDGIRLAESVPFEEFTVNVYLGSRQILGVAGAQYKYLTCRNRLGNNTERLFGFLTEGVATYETHFSTPASHMHVRTNFQPGYFDLDSPESQKYLRSGRKPLNISSRVNSEIGGWPGYLLFKIYTQGVSFASVAGPTLRDFVSTEVENGGFPRLYSYLEARC